MGKSNEGEELILLIFYLHFKYSPPSSAEARVESMVDEREGELGREMERKRKDRQRRERSAKERGREEEGEEKEKQEDRRGRGVGLCVSPKDSPSVGLT